MKLCPAGVCLSILMLAPAVDGAEPSRRTYPFSFPSPDALPDDGARVSTLVFPGDPPMAVLGALQAQQRVRVLLRLGPGRFLIASRDDDRPDALAAAEAAYDALPQEDQSFGSPGYSAEIGSIRPEQKIAENIHFLDVPDWARVGPNRRPGSDMWQWDLGEQNRQSLRVIVLFHRGIGRQRAEASFDGAGLDPGRFRLIGTRSWAGILLLPQIGELAQQNAVEGIELGPAPPLPLTSTSRAATSADAVHNATILLEQINYGGGGGEKIRIGISDSGVDEDHDDFSSDCGDGINGTKFYFSSPTLRDFHGTSVASIAASNGMSSQFEQRGYAPLACLGNYGYVTDFVSSYTDLVSASDVTNHSYTMAFSGRYSSRSVLIDEVVRGDVPDIPPRPQVWSVGNGGVGGLIAATAKNAIAVGAVESVNCTSSSCKISAVSSRGPTLDGRIKPDLVAPGCRTNSTGLDVSQLSTNDHALLSTCQTSYAAPAVTGTIALMLEAHRKTSALGELEPGEIRQHRPSQAAEIRSLHRERREKPSAPTVVDFALPMGAGNLRPATYKAVLIHSAEPVSGGEVAPSYDSGYGLLNVQQAVATVRKRSHWIEDFLDAHEDGSCYRINIGKRSLLPMLKVVVAWDDVAGTESLACYDDAKDTVVTCESQTTHLVNNLNAALHSPKGETVLAWGHDNPSDSFQRIGDDRNNVELLTAEAPVPGEWYLVVSIPGYLSSPTPEPTPESTQEPTPQPFSVVMSAPFEPIGCDTVSAAAP